MVLGLTMSLFFSSFDLHYLETDSVILIQNGPPGEYY